MNYHPQFVLQTRNNSKVDPNNNRNIQKDNQQNINQFVDICNENPRQYPMSFAGLQNYQIYIDKGNNSQLVKTVLLKRPWLSEVQQPFNFHLRWKPTSKDLPFSSLNNLNSIKKSMVNHLENHKEISTKTRLYNNLKNFCKKKSIKIDEFVPKTFIINLDSQQFQQDIKDFVEYYCKIRHPTIRNAWIFKPPDLNRGQGITLFSDLRQFFTNIQEYGKQSLLSSGQGAGKLLLPSIKQSVQKTVTIGYPQENGQQVSVSFQFDQNPTLDRLFVIQKYIENPFLVDGRKFDFRFWVLVDHLNTVYFFKEGYLRLSSENFDMSQKNLANLFVHLTNNAIQKTHPRYSRFELGNQLSLSDLQNYFSKKQVKISLREKIINRVKEIIMFTFNSAQEKLQNQKKFTFEIFGYDFMLDNLFNVWLIEANTNPCLEESSPLLQKLIPRMLNDAFRLTVDKVFNPTNNEKILDYTCDNFQVPGYQNEENLWEKIGNI